MLFAGATTAFAAKSPVAPDLSDVKNTEVPATQEELDRAKIVHITEAPPVPPRPAEASDYYYKFHNSVSLRAGAQLKLNDLGNPGVTLGLLYAYPLADLRGVEAGADLNSDATGTLHFSRREMVGNEKFRWFHKYGLGVRVVGSDQLVTFLRLRNWELRGGGGFEWTTFDPMSFRLDLESMLSTENIKFLATIGVAFAF